MLGETYLKARALITGASGHLGYHVAKAALEAGYQTGLLIRSRNGNIETLARAGAAVYVVDFNRPETYREILKSADVLFHVAAQNTTDTGDSKSVLANTSGLADRVLTEALECGVKTIVYTSSVVVLGRSPDPQRRITEEDRTATIESPYVQGKVDAERLCERLAETYGADIRTLYPSWLVGKHDLRGTPPQQMIARYLSKGQPFYFDGGISIAAVADVGRAHVAAFERGRKNGKYIVAGDNVTFQQFFDLLAELTGKSKAKIRIPKPVLVAGATVVDRALRLIGTQSPVDPAYMRSVIGSYSWYDSSRACTELDYAIRPARETLREGVSMERMRLAQTHLLTPRADALPLPGTRAVEQMPPLLLTGAPGWLGNRFIDILMNGDRCGRRYPYRKIRLLVERRQVGLLDLPPQFEIVPGDLLDPRGLDDAVAGVGTVIHMAGAIYPKKIETLYRVNTDGTKCLVDACIRAGVRRFLFMSTDSVCGHGTPEKRIFDENTPDSPYRNYGRSKQLAEQYILEKARAGQLDATILRGFWFFGPFSPARQESFLNLLQKGPHIVFGNGKNFRSISHVDNLVGAFLETETEPRTYGRVYWIGDEKPDYTVDDIYSTFCNALGTTYRPIYLPGLVCAGCRLADTLLGLTGRLDPTIHGAGKFAFDIAGRVDAAKRDFGYEPIISLEDYAREYAAFTRRNRIAGSAENDVREGAEAPKPQKTL
jgi:nucleoside-diphosphate-sugar epimerase